MKAAALRKRMAASRKGWRVRRAMAAAHVARETLPVCFAGYVDLTSRARRAPRNAGFVELRVEAA